MTAMSTWVYGISGYTRQQLPIVTHSSRSLAGNRRWHRAVLNRSRDRPRGEQSAELL